MAYSRCRQRERGNARSTDRETGRLHMKIWLTIAAASILLIASGCAGEPSREASPADPSGSKETPPAASMPAPEDATARPEQTPEPEQPAAEESKSVISVASPQTEEIDPGKPVELQPAKEPEPGPAPSDTGTWLGEAEEFTFNPEQPTLMGISVGTDLETVRRLFGEPVSTYLLPDDGVKAAVYRYKGFSVGVADRKVLFVEVNSADVDPGLNGVRIGDAREHAEGKMGAPATETAFVLMYKSSESILRLDLDPDSSLIHSIKLFPAND